MSRTMHRAVGLSGVAVVLAATFGCDSRPATAPVSGVVTLDGQPLAFGKVMLQGVQGGQPASGDIGPDGAFTLSTFRPGDGAMIGKHRVRVVCYSSQDPANPAYGAAGDSLGRLLIPERYTSLGASGLSVEVPPDGLADFAIELSSQGPGR